MNNLEFKEEIAEYDSISEYIHDYAIEAEVVINVDLPTEFSIVSNYVNTYDSDRIYDVYKMLQSSIRYALHMLRNETSSDETLTMVVDHYLQHYELDNLRDRPYINAICSSVMHVTRIVEDQLHKHDINKLFCVEVEELPVLDCSLFIYIYTEEYYG